MKRKLERRITELGGNPNTITAMSEAYFKKNQIKTEGRIKYRRVIKRPIAQVGDIPLDHLNEDRLRELRDAQAETNKASAIQSLFTPIRGMFKYAIGEGKISHNPMHSVMLKPEKRSTQMIKWKPFSPSEVRRIFAAMDEVWGSPLRGMADELRLIVIVSDFGQRNEHPKLVMVIAVRRRAGQQSCDLFGVQFIDDFFDRREYPKLCV